MTDKEYFDYVNSGNVVKCGSEYHKHMTLHSMNAQKITSEINNKYNDPEKLRRLFSKLINKPVDEEFGLFPPFYTDCGLNIHIGKNVFINSCCCFQDQGGIYIGDKVLIGHNVVLATLNHGLKPSERGDLYPAPIYIENNVWIGSNSTITAGVTIGENAVIAAGAVVTKNIPPNTVYGGVPAKFLKNID